MRISLIVDPRCGSDSSQAPVQRRLILTPNKYRKSAVRPSAMGELQGANTRSSKDRSNKKETAHTTHNSHFMSSVAISVHCCLHWCSHLAFIPLHRCSHQASFALPSWCARHLGLLADDALYRNADRWIYKMGSSEWRHQKETGAVRMRLFGHQDVEQRPNFCPDRYERLEIPDKTNMVCWIGP